DHPRCEILAAPRRSERHLARVERPVLRRRLPRHERADAEPEYDFAYHHNTLLSFFSVTPKARPLTRSRTTTAAGGQSISFREETQVRAACRDAPFWRVL